MKALHGLGRRAIMKEKNAEEIAAALQVGGSDLIAMVVAERGITDGRAAPGDSPADRSNAVSRICRPRRQKAGTRASSGRNFRKSPIPSGAGATREIGFAVDAMSTPPPDRPLWR